MDLVKCYGGETGIRTLGTLSSTHAFQACALNHSAISPKVDRLNEFNINRRPSPQAVDPGAQAARFPANRDASAIAFAARRARLTKEIRHSCGRRLRLPANLNASRGADSGGSFRLRSKGSSADPGFFRYIRDFRLVPDAARLASAGRFKKDQAFSLQWKRAAVVSFGPGNAFCTEKPVLRKGCHAYIGSSSPHSSTARALSSRQ